MWDALIIGAGPAGLTAAVYLARYRRAVIVLDAGESRAQAIPSSHNHPGFASGISGPALLARLREQAKLYQVEIRRARVEDLSGTEGAFVARLAEEKVGARRVLLASGIRDETPDLPGLDGAVARALLRFCPICDAYEALDKSIAVVGPPGPAASKAEFLRTYSKSVTILPLGSEQESALAAAPGVEIVPPPRSFRQTPSGLEVSLCDGSSRSFDVLYAALGCAVRSELAARLGARTNAAGNLEVDAKQQTSVPGVYAAGDVVSDLHQLCVAEAHAAIAATAIHNGLPANHR